MKKFMKVCAVIALVCVVIGAATAIIAGSLVGKGVMEEVVNSLPGNKIHLSLSPANWGFTISDLDGKDGKNGKNDEVLFDINDSEQGVFDKDYPILSGSVEKSFESDKVNHLCIQLGGCSFEVKESKDCDIWVIGEGMTKMQSYIENDTLYIKSINRNIVSVGSKVIDAEDLELYLPKNFAFDSVEIDLGAGEIDFDDLIAESLSMKVGAGEIDCSNVVVKTADINVGVGDITFKELQADSVTAEVSMGNLDLQGAINKKAVLKCAMGNIDMRVDGKEKDFNYKIESAMGNVDIGRSNYAGLSKEKKIDNGADKDMTVSCAMGNISISF